MSLILLYNLQKTRIHGLIITSSLGVQDQKISALLKLQETVKMQPFVS